MKKWIDEIIESMQRLGGDATYKDLYEDIQKHSRRDLEKLKDFKAQIRGTIEQHSSDSKVFKGTPGSEKDVFFAISGLGNGHWGLRNKKEYQNSKINLTANLEEFPEGKIILTKHLKRERNASLIQKAKTNFLKKHKKLFCEACSFNFQEKYVDSINTEFIEAHHLKPISEMKEEDKTNINDIVMLCPNCHRMIHRYRPWIKEKKDLKNILR